MPILTWNERLTKLYNYFGTHTAVAKALGISYRQLTHIRLDPANRMSGSVRNLIRVYCRLIDLQNDYATFKRFAPSLLRTDWHA